MFKKTIIKRKSPQPKKVEPTLNVRIPQSARNLLTDQKKKLLESAIESTILAICNESEKEKAFGDSTKKHLNSRNCNTQRTTVLTIKTSFMDSVNESKFIPSIETSGTMDTNLITQIFPTSDEEESKTLHSVSDQSPTTYGN